MPPKNQSKEKGSRKERAKNSALVGAAIGLVIIGVSNTDITDGATSGKTHVTAEPNQRAEGGSIFCSDPKPVETVNVTASQIVNYDTSAEIGKLPNIKKLSDINKIEFAYNHDVIQNPQEA